MSPATSWFIAPMWSRHCSSDLPARSRTSPCARHTSRQRSRRLGPAGAVVAAATCSGLSTSPAGDSRAIHDSPPIATATALATTIPRWCGLAFSWRPCGEDAQRVAGPTGSRRLRTRAFPPPRPLVAPTAGRSHASRADRVHTVGIASGRGLGVAPLDVREPFEPGAAQAEAAQGLVRTRQPGVHLTRGRADAVRVPPGPRRRDVHPHSLHGAAVPVTAAPTPPRCLPRRRDG